MDKGYVPTPERLRNIKTCRFGWIDHRFLKDGFLQNLSGEALKLYVFLVLVANKSGTSWYSYDRICSLLNLDVDTYLKARHELLRCSLIGYDNDIFQVLSLPAKARQSEPITPNHQREVCRAEDFRSLKNLLSQLTQVES